MMTNQLKVTGIYDRKTLKMLNTAGVNKVGFDFRVKSFNFLQQYLFLELMESSYQPFSKYYLQYQDEADFVIQKMIDDLFQQVEIQRSDNSIFLEFSDIKSAQFYDQFKLPFCWHFQDFDGLIEVIRSQYITGIVVGYQLLEHLHKSENLDEFVTAFKRITKSKKLELTLAIDWDADIFPSISEYINFDIHSFAINQKTEISYRNVDMIAVKKHLQQYL